MVRGILFCDGKNLLFQSFSTLYDEERQGCENNIDTVCVELVYTDGSVIAVDTIAVENENAEDMYQRSELD